jgi:hypothetical protein
VHPRRAYDLTDACVLDADAADGISPLGRALGRVSGRVLVANLGGGGTGFGRGPRPG